MPLGLYGELITALLHYPEAGGAFDDSSCEGGVGGCETGVCTTEGIMLSEEIIMVGELCSRVILALEVTDEMDRPFRACP